MQNRVTIPHHEDMAPPKKANVVETANGSQLQRTVRAACSVIESSESDGNADAVLAPRKKASGSKKAAVSQFQRKVRPVSSVFDSSESDGDVGTYEDPIHSSGIVHESTPRMKKSNDIDSAAILVREMSKRLDRMERRLDERDKALKSANRSVQKLSNRVATLESHVGTDLRTLDAGDISSLPDGPSNLKVLHYLKLYIPFCAQSILKISYCLYLVFARFACMPQCISSCSVHF